MDSCLTFLRGQDDALFLFFFACVCLFNNRSDFDFTQSRYFFFAQWGEKNRDNKTGQEVQITRIC